MLWRNPVAWFGLATLLIPVAIHLLVRHRAEPRPFPSLRFVQPTRLASVRRKMISDWPLLLLRIATLAVAVAALADPLWQSASRRAEWNERQARAIVVDTTPSVAGATSAGGAAPIVEREAAGAFRAETIKATGLADGIRRASDWLRTAPPARRELVVISDFQLGTLDASMLRDLPPYVGIRFVRTPGAPVTRSADGLSRTQRAAAGGFTLRNPRVTLNTNETAVTWTDAASPSSVKIDASNDGITLRPFDVTLRGSAADRPYLIAASEAVLSQGVPLAPSQDAGGPADGGRRAGAGKDAADRGAEASPSTASAAGAGGRNAATLIITNAASDGAAAPSAQRAGTLSAPWQVDAARAIATDASLTRAVGRATASAHAAAGTTSSATKSPELPSSQATAKSRTASNDAPAPWIVLMRDAGGQPAILAAAEGADAKARLLVWSRVAAGDEATALLIRATLRALAGSDAFGEAEVMAIPDATLAQWQRPSSEPPATEWRNVDGNDRRWLWGVVIALLVAEQVMRRRARHAEAQTERKVFDNAA